MTEDLQPPPSLFIPGDNCQTVAGFGRLAVLVDGAAYFAALEEALSRARRRVVIVGWDFNSLVKLRPERGEAALGLGDFLLGLVEANPQLDLHLLIWRNSIFYGSNVDLPLPLLPRWSDHPRIHFKLDDMHPWGACHHQKIVCIDEALAFTGGMDLTQGRWDTPDHAPENPLRRDDAGEPYRPVHDVQVMVDGEAAKAIGRIAADRWQAAGGESLAPLSDIVGPDIAAPWPDRVPADLRDHALAIARTLPAQADGPEISEVRSLNEAMLLAATRSIYVESQYFAVAEIAEILAWQLGRPQGPDVVLVVNCESSGMLEHYVMANNRDRMFALLRHADRHGRLRTYHPTSCSEPECQIKIHSKLLIVDDRLLRIGSSNFNSRSLGLDTECDVALEGATAATRQVIARVQARLLGEHLGVSPTEFAVALAREGRLAGAVDALNGRSQRRLTLYPELPADTELTLATGSSILDPDRPIDLKYLWDKLSSSSALEISPRARAYGPEES
ncbi:MAG TPA: phospholipase D-like domain-containing protein [Alphaproteobacteria bacterium]